MGIRHISMSIEGLERDLSSKTRIGAGKFCTACFGLNLADVEKILARMKSEGKKYIPSEGCPNVKEDGSCGCVDAEIGKKS